MGADATTSPKKYPYIVEKAPRNYSAFFPDVPGVATGKTKSELVERMSEVLALTLLDYAERGEAPPAPTPLDRLDVSEYEPEEPYEILYVEPATVSEVSLELQKALDAAGISQSELARRLGKDRATVSRLVNPFYFGHTVSTLKEVARALETDLVVSFARGQHNRRKTDRINRGEHQAQAL